MHPENLFAFLGIMFGILFSLITPPFQVPDETLHFYRILQISDGRLTALNKGDGIGGLVPESVVTTVKTFDDVLLHVRKEQKIENINAMLDLPLEKAKTVFVDFPNTALYSPVPYLPQTAGIATGKLIGLSPLKLMYLGRLFNLLVWVIFVYYAIRIIPIHKWTFLLLALTPMSLSQAASLSAGGLTNGTSFLLFALFLKRTFDEGIARKDHLYAIFILSAILSLSKQAYFLFPLLFLLFPVKSLGSRKKYLTLFFFLMLISIVPMLAWSALMKDTYLAVFRIYADFFNRHFHMVPAPDEQIKFIISQPVEYVRILVRTFVQNGNSYLEQFIGHLGWLDAPLPEALIIMYVIMLMGVAVIDNKEGIALYCKQKILIAVLVLASVVLISTMLYLNSTPAGNTYIVGIQGRYFTPLSPLLSLLLYNGKVRFSTDRAGFRLLIACISLLSLSWTLLVIVHRYYV